MGYNGLGLQKWIYTQRARRPFTKDRKPSGNSSDYHHDNEYIEKVLTSKGKKRKITDEDSNRASIRLDKKIRDLKQFLIIKRIMIGVLVFLALSLIIYSYIDTKRPKTRNTQMLTAMAESNCERALFYFNQGRFYAARDKYLDAIKINPNLFKAYHGLALTYGNLCPESDVHCVNTLKIIDRIKNKFPEEDISDLIELEYRIKEKLEIN